MLRYWITLFISSGFIIFAFVLFYCWRTSAFDTTTSYLQNVQRVHSDETGTIYMYDSTKRVYSKVPHRPALYYEYSYKVNGKEYIDHFYYDGDDYNEPLESIVKMYYDPNHPQRCYREGTLKKGILLGIFSLIFGLILFVPSLMCILQ